MRITTQRIKFIRILLNGFTLTSLLGGIIFINSAVAQESAQKEADRTHCRKAVWTSPGANYNGYYKCLRERGLSLNHDWWRSEVKRHCDNSIYFTKPSGQLRTHLARLFFSLVPKGEDAWRKCYQERGIEPDGPIPQHIPQNR